MWIFTAETSFRSCDFAVSAGWDYCARLLTESRKFKAQFVVEFEKIVDTDNTWRSST
jgi:hypothetical protein